MRRAWTRIKTQHWLEHPRGIGNLRGRLHTETSYLHSNMTRRPKTMGIPDLISRTRLIRWCRWFRMTRMILRILQNGLPSSCLTITVNLPLGAMTLSFPVDRQTATRILGSIPFQIRRACAPSYVCICRIFFVISIKSKGENSVVDQKDTIWVHDRDAMYAGLYPERSFHYQTSQLVIFLLLVYSHLISIPLSICRSGYSYLSNIPACGETWIEPFGRSEEETPHLDAFLTIFYLNLWSLLLCLLYFYFYFLFLSHGTSCWRRTTQKKKIKQNKTKQTNIICLMGHGSRGSKAAMQNDMLKQKLW